jgi:MFS family permease
MLRSVLTSPGVPRVFSASLVARIPSATIGLLLILRVHELGGSYATGGAAAGALALGLAAGAPFVGRAIDARGQTRVLAACAAAAAAALATLALLPAGTPGGVVIGLAAVTGLAQPPMSACMRALWPSLVGGRERQHAALALESAGIEVVFVLGPAVLGGAVAAYSPALALGLCAALLVGGTAVFARHPASRGWAPASQRPADAAGALASRGLRALVVTQACIGLSFGAIEVSVAAFCGRAGAASASGLILAVWGAASMAGGLMAARRGAAADPVARLAVLLGVMATADLLLVAAPSPAMLALAIAAAGAPIAPIMATVYALAGDVAREGTTTEAFTWLTTGIGAGLAAGSTLAGALVGAGAHAGFAVAAAAVAGAAVTVARSRARALRPAAAPC